MVTIHTLEIQEYRFLLIEMKLYLVTLFCIASTKGMGVDSCFNLEELAKKENLAVFQWENKKEIPILQRKVTGMTSKAADSGIYIGMSVENALVRLVKNEKNPEESQNRPESHSGTVVSHTGPAGR